MALLLELLEVAGLELPRELRETEHRQALQGVPDEAYGWDLPLASSDAEAPRGLPDRPPPFRLLEHRGEHVKTEGLVVPVLTRPASVPSAPDQCSERHVRSVRAGTDRTEPPP